MHWDSVRLAGDEDRYAKDTVQNQVPKSCRHRIQAEVSVRDFKVDTWQSVDVLDLTEGLKDVRKSFSVMRRK